MQDVFREAVNLLDQGDPVVVATVVRTKGSTPQKPGAKLLVRKDGSGVGTLGGGCVEGDIWFAAKQLMRSGGPAMHREYLLNEDLAAEDGLVCGGTMFFLIDPVYQPDSYLSYAREIDAAYRGEGPVALASLIKPGNGAETPVGAKLFIRENGETEGSLGDPELDRQAAQKARELMVHGKSDYVVADSGVEYFIEASERKPKELVPGARIRTCWGEQMLLSLVEVDANSEVPLHTHPHEQGGVIIEGELEMGVDGEVKLLKPGDMYIIPGNVEHYAKAYAVKVVALDIFSPVREEFKF